MKVIDNWGQRASMNAAAAIKLDSQGHKTEAIEHYWRAINALDKLVHIYPDYDLNRFYMERANAYHNKVKAIGMGA
jgi:hypothetical protein